MSETEAPTEEPDISIDEPVKPPPTLRERAYALRFDPLSPPAADDICLLIGEYPIGARANIIGVQGQSKVGKSSVIAALLGAALRGGYATTGDTFQFAWDGESTGAVIHIDTEQSPADWHALVVRAFGRSGLPEIDPRFVSLPLVQFARIDRLQILKETLQYEYERLGKIDLVVVDGVADLCNSPNDEEEALALVQVLMALSHQYCCVIVLVLHENPGAQGTYAKTRGHLGSELNRKAYANLRVEKDAETLVSTIFGTDMRKRDLPKNHGFCFAWDDAAGGHVFMGRSADLKAAQKEKEAREKALAEWVPIFEWVGENGTNANVPMLSVQQAIDAEQEMNGTKKKTGYEAMKKRMQRAESVGALRKADRTAWSLNNNGTKGTPSGQRDVSHT